MKFKKKNINEGYKVKGFKATKLPGEGRQIFKIIFNKTYKDEDKALEIAKDVSERISDVYGLNYVEVYDIDGRVLDTFTGPYNASKSMGTFQEKLDEEWSGIYKPSFLVKELGIDKEEAKEFSVFLYDNHADEGYKAMRDIADDYTRLYDGKSALEYWYDEFKETSLNEDTIKQDDLRVVYVDFFKGPIVLSEPDSIQTAKNIADEYAVNIAKEYDVPSTVEVKDSSDKVVYSVSARWDGYHCFIIRDGKEMRAVPKWTGVAYKLTEDTIKQDGKWVNKGKEGTHGKFKTKKAADAQRKAMFANGYKEGLNESQEGDIDFIKSILEYLNDPSYELYFDGDDPFSIRQYVLTTKRKDAEGRERIKRLFYRLKDNKYIQARFGITNLMKDKYDRALLFNKKDSIHFLKDINIEQLINSLEKYGIVLSSNCVFRDCIVLDRDSVDKIYKDIKKVSKKTGFYPVKIKNCIYFKDMNFEESLDNTKAGESLNEASKLDIIKSNKEDYAELENKIRSMPDGIEKDISIEMGLKWIKGNNWLGGLSDSVANKAAEKISNKYNIDIYDVFDIFDGMFIKPEMKESMNEELWDSSRVRDIADYGWINGMSADDTIKLVINQMKKEGSELPKDLFKIHTLVNDYFDLFYDEENPDNWEDNYVWDDLDESFKEDWIYKKNVPPEFEIVAYSGNTAVAKDRENYVILKGNKIGVSDLPKKYKSKESALRAAGIKKELEEDTIGYKNESLDFGKWSEYILNIDADELAKNDLIDFRNKLDDSNQKTFDSLSSFEQELLVAEDKFNGLFWRVFDGDEKMINKINSLKQKVGINESINEGTTYTQAIAKLNKKCENIPYINGNYPRYVKLARSILYSQYKDDNVEGFLRSASKNTFSRYTQDDLKKACKLLGYDYQYLSRYMDNTDNDFNESLNEASYGGAFDIENDQFFTREEINEFAYDLLDDFKDWASGEFSVDSDEIDLRDVDMTSPTHLVVEIDDNGAGHIAEVDIDMRKIRKPSDIYKYFDYMLRQWKNSYLEYHDEYFDDYQPSLTQDPMNAGQWYESLNEDRWEVVKDYKYQKGDELTLWWKTPSGETQYARVEYAGRDRDKNYKFISTTYGWTYLVSKDKDKVKMPNKDVWYDRISHGDNDFLPESLNEEIDEYDDEFYKGDDGNFYKELKSKSVYDSDGFITDYTLYMKVVPDGSRADVEFVTVFGDNELYRPEDGYYDFECNDVKEAIEWFNNYDTDEEPDNDDIPKLTQDDMQAGQWYESLNEDYYSRYLWPNGSPVSKDDVIDALQYMYGFGMNSIIRMLNNNDFTDEEIQRAIDYFADNDESLNEARYSDAYDDNRKKQGWWYFTTHGVQPGSIPKDLNVIEIKDGKNSKGTLGTFVKLDGILNTDELKKFDMKEEVPMNESVSNFNPYEAGQWNYTDEEIETAIEYCDSNNIKCDNLSDFEQIIIDVNGITESLEEDLVDPTNEDIESFEDLLNEFGFEVEGKGKTLFGNTHYQIIYPERTIDVSEIRPIATPLVDKLHTWEEEHEIPVTWNFGLNKDGYLTAGMDLQKKWIPESLNQKSSNINEELYIKEAYNDYDPEDGWTEEDIELHKSIDWKARNYEEYDAGDSVTMEVVLYGLDEPEFAKVEMHKFLRSNPIYPPYYRPVMEKPFGMDIPYVGPMYDGNTYKTYDVHDRYETQETYDMLSDSLRVEKKELSLREKLNKLDHEGLDNNNYLDLVNLYEAVNDRLNAQEKQELKKLVDTSNDPEVISSYLNAKLNKDKNKGINNENN